MKHKNWWAIAFAGLGAGSLIVVGLAVLWHLLGIRSETMDRWAGLPIDFQSAQKVCMRDTVWFVASMPVHYQSEPVAPKECSEKAVVANFVDVDKLNRDYPEANCRATEGFKIACDQEIEIFKLLLTPTN